MDAPLQLRAERMAAGGDAIAREPGGRIVFVDGALPGEVVGARLTQDKRDYARAVVEEILEPAAARVEPPCRHARQGCGGCSWQHVAPAAQLGLKADIVRDALRRTGGLPDAEVAHGPSLALWAFRTTLRLAARRDGRLAFRARRSHELVGVDECLVAHPRLAELVVQSRFPGASEVTLRCSAATGERLALADPPSVIGKAPGDVVQGEGAFLHEVVDGISLRVSARSFFQTRADGARVLVEAVRLAAGTPVTTMVDAYAGVGLFAATLGLADRVFAVERSASSCSDARYNLAGLDCAVHEEAVEEWEPQPADLVVADPARAGLGRRAAEVLAATGAARLVLVSCDPVSLARDARLLAGWGFRHMSSTVVDLFPHTPHVEVVTRFDRT